MLRTLTSIRQWISVPLICGALVMVVGCAGKPPVETLSRADLAVQEADKKTASQYAPLELKTAREQLDQANRAMHEKEYDEARRWADQALVNAQLAEAKTGAEKARQAAAELQKSIQTLRAELERAATSR
jgi:hypothetical protein